MRRMSLLLIIVSFGLTPGFVRGVVLPPGEARAAGIPAPADVLGFRPGEDRHLARWEQIVDYFRRLDAASDRLIVDELGRTTLDRPFIAATISAPENLRRLDHFRRIQQRLADPRTISDQTEAERLIAEGRAIVLITFGIHSTEVGGPLTAMNLAYRLTSDDGPEVNEILRQCIILLVPALNPDGVDIVKRWYDRTLGTPYEGTAPPELYHHYVGHDNNRDWYAFTQVETQLTVDKLHNVWHPHIVHDVHQQGPYGSRFFVPPFIDPIEPNVDPLIVQGINFMGTAIAWELTGRGFPGVVINAIYDAWTPARAYQHYHGGIRILSETASARLASPITVRRDELRPGRNFDPRRASWNFPMPWKGGEWHLSDIVRYMEAGAMALLRNAARYRERWIRHFYLIGRRAIEPRPGKPFAFLILNDEGTNPVGRARLVEILLRGGVEIHRAERAFAIEGTSYPPGTLVVFLSQPYSAFAKTLLERQRYPDLRQYPGGPPKPPYDVTAHTLPLLMGVPVVTIEKPFRGEFVRQRSAPPVERRRLRPARLARIGLYQSYRPSMDEGWTRWIFDQYDISYTILHDEDIRRGDLRSRVDVIILPDQSPRAILHGLPQDRYPPEYTGGLSSAGIEALRTFVTTGGRLVALNRASSLVVQQFALPIEDVLQGVKSDRFYCPGSILRLRVETGHPLARGMPASSVAWFERGSAFRVRPGGESRVRVVARYGDGNPLLSGWILGPEHIAGRAALVEVTVGRGRVILFGFRPQYRGQSVATFPLLFNALAYDWE